MDVKISVNFNGLDKAFVQKQNMMNSQVSKLARDLTDIAYKWVQREAPRKTGNLKARGIRKSISGNTGIVFTSKADVKYVDWVIDGTRPHDIVPKRKQALSWPGGSHPVKRVHHPGTRSNPFVDRGAQNMEGEFTRRLAQFEKWLEEV